MRNLRLSYERIHSSSNDSSIPSPIIISFQTSTSTTFHLTSNGSLFMEDHLINDINTPISGAHYSKSEDNLLIATTSGTLFLWREELNTIISIGCWKDGISTMVVSPNDEIISCITGNTLFLLERNDSFEIINDEGYSFLFDENYDNDDSSGGLNKEGHGSQSLGWGTIETQFQGPKLGGKEKKSKPQKVKSINAHIQWSPSSNHLIVAPKSSTKRHIINARGANEGYLIEDCEWRSSITENTFIDSPNDPILAWSPRPEEAAPISVVSPGKSETGHIIRLYEINGLSHGEFEVQRSLSQEEQNFSITKMQYNSDGSILCIQWEDSLIQFWARCNYEWTLKAEIKGQNFSFSLTNPLIFYVSFCNNLSYKGILSWHCDYRRNGEECHVIKGSSLCITSFSKEILPPPLYRRRLFLPPSFSTPCSVIFPKDHQIISSDFMGNVVLFVDDKVFKTFSLDSMISKIISYDDLNDEIQYYNQDNNAFSYKNGISTTLKDPLLDENNHKDHLHLEDERDLLFFKGNVLLENCNSFLLLKRFHSSIILAMDTMGYLHSFLLGNDVIDSNGGGVKELPSRLVERGAVLLFYRENDLSIICQTLPRGNLEVLRIRSVLLSIELPNLIFKRCYPEALLLCRRHRLDYNLVYDLNPRQFISELPRTIKRLEKMDLLVHFITSINSSSSCIHKWKEYYTYQEGGNCDGDGDGDGDVSKKKNLLKEIRKVLLQQDRRDSVEALITTFLLQEKADVRGALALLLDDKYCEEEKENYLQYIMFLAPHDNVWMEALRGFEDPSISLPMALSITRRFQTQGTLQDSSSMNQRECEQVILDWMSKPYKKELKFSIMHYINCHLEAALALGVVEEKEDGDGDVDDFIDDKRIEEYVNVWNIEKEWISKMLLEKDSPLKRRIFLLVAQKYSPLKGAPSWIKGDLLSLGGDHKAALSEYNDSSLIDHYLALADEGDAPYSNVKSLYDVLVLNNTKAVPILPLAISGASLEAWIPAIRSGELNDDIKHLEDAAILTLQIISDKKEEFLVSFERYHSLTLLLVLAIKESLLAYEKELGNNGAKLSSSLPGRINQYCREDVPLNNSLDDGDALSIQSGTWSMNSLLSGIMSISSMGSSDSSTSIGKGKKEKKKLERQRQRGKANGPWERHSLRDLIGEIRDSFKKNNDLGKRILLILQSLSLFSTITKDPNARIRSFELQREIVSCNDEALREINSSYRKMRLISSELILLLKSHRVLVGVFGRTSGEALLSPLPLPLQFDHKWREVFCLSETGDLLDVDNSNAAINSEIDIPLLKDHFEYL